MSSLNRKFLYPLIIAVVVVALFLVLPSLNFAQVAPAPAPPAQPAQLAQKPGFFSGLVQRIQNLLGIGPAVVTQPAVTGGPGTGTEPFEMGPFNFDLPSGFPDDIPSDGQPDPPLAYIHMNPLLPPYNLWPIRLEPNGSPVCAPESDCQDPNDSFVFGINTRDRDKRNDDFSFTVSNSFRTGENMPARLILLGGSGNDRAGTRNEAMPMARASFTITNTETGYRISAKAFRGILPLAVGPEGTQYYGAKFRVNPPSGVSALVAITLKNPAFKMSGDSVELFANAIRNNPDYTFANLLQEDPLPRWKQNMINVFLNGIPLLKKPGILAKIQEAQQALAAAEAISSKGLLSEAARATLGAEIKLNLLNWIKLAIIGQIKNETMDLDMALSWVCAQWLNDYSVGGGNSETGGVYSFPNNEIPFADNPCDQIENFLSNNQDAINNLKEKMQEVIENGGTGSGTVLNDTADLLEQLGSN